MTSTTGRGATSSGVKERSRTREKVVGMTVDVTIGWIGKFTCTYCKWYTCWLTVTRICSTLLFVEWISSQNPVFLLFDLLFLFHIVLVSVATPVKLIMIFIENGPTVLDVLIIESIEVEEAEDEIVTVLRGLRIWGHLWRECDSSGMIDQDMVTITMAVEVKVVVVAVGAVVVLGVLTIIPLLIMVTITMATTAIAAGSFVLLCPSPSRLFPWILC